MPKQFRNVTNDDRGVSYGVVGPARRIPAEGVVTVTDAAAPSYECQPAIWEEVFMAPPKQDKVSPGSPAPAQEEA